MKKNIDMTTGSISNGFIIYSIPVFLSAIFQQFYSTVDLLIVARFGGNEDMAAIGTTGAVTNLVIALFFGLSIGTTILVSQYYAAKKEKELSKTIHTSYAFSVIFGVICTVIAYIITPEILRMMQTPENIFDSASGYMRLFMICIIPTMLYNNGAGIMRAVGDSKRPFLFLVFSSLVNIILDMIFVAYFKMGAYGAGIATLVAQVFSAILVTFSLMMSDEDYKLRLSSLEVDKKYLEKIIKVGVPTGLQSSIISFSNVIIQSKINVFGSNVIAGVAASGRIDGFLFTGMTAFSAAAMTFSAQNIGAGKTDRLKKGARIAVAIVTGFTLILSALILIFRYELMKIFNADPEVVYYGQRILIYLALFYWVLAICDVLGGIIRGSGNTLPVMLIALTSMFVVRLIWIYLGLYFFNSIDVIFVAYPITWTVYLIMVLLYYKKGKWRSIKI